MSPSFCLEANINCSGKMWLKLLNKSAIAEFNTKGLQHGVLEEHVHFQRN